MDAAARSKAAELLDRAALCVLAQHGLAAEAKLAWLQLWHGAGGKPGTVSLHPAALGEKQGAADPLRSGKNNLEALARWGLVQILDRFRASWTVYVEDPVEVANRRLERVAGDGQGELFREEPAEEPKSPPREVLRIRPPPEAAAQPKPASVVQQTPVLSAAIAQSTPISRSLRGRGKEEDLSRSEVEVSSRSDLETGGNCATDAGLLALKRRVARERQPETETPVGGEIAKALQAVAAASDRRREAGPQEAAKIAAWITAEVADPKLQADVVESIAWAIVEDRYPRGKLGRILTKLRVTHAQRSAKDRGSYFVAIMRRSFTEAGLELCRKKVVPPPASPPAGGGEEVPT